MGSKLNKFICNFFVSALLIFAKLGYAEQKIQFVEATGRAVISNQESINIARRNALEDAIFLAAIQGGAKIDGFSSIDKETNLTEHFTLRPATELLDYTIIEESIDEEHYKTTIRAAVGELSSTGCSTRSKAKIIKFSAELNFSSAVPAWLRQVGDEIAIEITERLRNDKRLTLIDASLIELNISELTTTDDSFDYESLTQGRLRVDSGDFALVPSISMEVRKSKKNIETEIFLIVSVNSTLYQGEDYQFVDGANYDLILKLQSETPWRTFDMLGRKTRDQIRLSVNSGLDEHISELIDKLQCVPLTAKIKLRDNKLVVNLGHDHGISTNSLAISSGINTAYSILHVTQVFSNQSIVEPLNTSLEISSLVGKTINFMETYQ